MKIRDVLELDLHKKDEYKYIYVKQYDVKSRFIDIILYNDGDPYVIDSDIIARIRGTKPDKTYFIKDCPIVDNVVEVEINKVMTSTKGRVICDIGLYKPSNTGNPEDDKLLSSAVFYLVVSPSAYSEDAVVSSSEFKTLTELIAENRILGEQLQSKITLASQLIEQMEQILNT